MRMSSTTDSTQATTFSSNADYASGGVGLPSSWAWQADRQAMAARMEMLERRIAEVERDRRAAAAGYRRAMLECLALRRERSEQALGKVVPAEEVAALERDREAIRHDRDAKAEVVQRVVAEIEALRSDRDSKAEVVQRLVVEIEALRSDRDAKAQIVDRLIGELDAIRQDRDASLAAAESDRDALRRDRDSTAANAARLAGELSARSATLETESTMHRDDVQRLRDGTLVLRQKIAATQTAIAETSARELERKAIFKGAQDLLFHAFRKHRLPGYAQHVPAGTAEREGLHVGVDAMEIVFGISGGVEVYMKTLVDALLRSRRNVTIVCLPQQVKPLQAMFEHRVGYLVMRSAWAVRHGFSIANALGKTGPNVTARYSMATFSRLAQDAGIALLHSPVQIFSVTDFNIPSVLNLHDLQHLHFPDNFRPSDVAARTRLYGLSAGLADAIIASSEFVRRDIIDKMRVPASKVFTLAVCANPLIEHGLASFGPQQARTRYKLPATYAIYPAQFWPHKNHVNLVEALRLVRERRPAADLHMVLTGSRAHSGWPAVATTIERHRLGDAVHCLDYVPIEHLAGLYKGAVFCVMPSTFEASSYPVIEAQLLGVPAMCSNVTSLPELVRDGAGLLFDPSSPEAIADQMLRWLDDTDDRDAHAVRGQARARAEHTMDGYIEGLARVYDHVLASGN